MYLFVSRAQFIFICITVISIVKAHTPSHIMRTFTAATEHYKNGNYDAAAELYKEIMHTNNTIRYNYGLCCHHRGLFDAAHAAFLDVYACDAQHSGALSKIKLHALRTQRWDLAHQYGLKPYWWYDASIQNKTVVCTSNNAGIGDIVQFLRYLRHLHDAGAYVILEAPRYLHNMLCECSYIDKVVLPNSNYQSDITIRVSTPELTLTMRNMLQQPSCDVPYLHTNKERSDYWQQTLSQDSCFKVGLCWRSSMMQDHSGNLIPSPRSIPLSSFSSLFDYTQCSFYSLQVGHGTEELLENTFPIHEFDATFDKKHGAFSDTLAVMQQLDLIITVDTSIAHIAGALGVPVWVILPVCADFRWFVDNDTSPWYPTMKLFRQKKYGEWESVLQEVSMHLGKLIE